MSNLTYRKLKEAIEAIPENQLDDNVTIYDPADEEFYQALTTEITDEEVDVLDPGHLIIVIQK